MRAVSRYSLLSCIYSKKFFLAKLAVLLEKLATQAAGLLLLL